MKKIILIIIVLFLLIVGAGYFFMSSFYDGEISECKYNGEKVYGFSLNAYDAEGVFYNKNNKKIGECNYAYSDINNICKDGKVTQCETIFNVRNNIWGTKPVFKLKAIQALLITKKF